MAAGKRCSDAASLWILLSLFLQVQLVTCPDPADDERSVSSILHSGPKHGMNQAGEEDQEEDQEEAQHPLRRLLQVMRDGKPCILFRARRIAIRYQNNSLLDLTRLAFSPEHPVNTKGSVCSKDKAQLVMRFGDVEDLRGLSLRLQMSSTFYESAGQSWFSVDQVSLHYNWSQEARFNASEVYAPSTSSYHCQHVSSLPHYSPLLAASSNSDPARLWSLTFTDFQIQAFNVLSGKFSLPANCATFLTPAIMMGLITSLILLLVLAYALHMVIHLKHIDHYDHKTTVYFPRSPESDACSADKNSL